MKTYLLESLTLLGILALMFTALKVAEIYRLG